MKLLKDKNLYFSDVTFEKYEIRITQRTLTTTNNPWVKIHRTKALRKFGDPVQDTKVKDTSEWYKNN